MEQFLVPAGEGASEYMEKKSRFLGLIVPVTTEAEARARLEAQLLGLHPAFRPEALQR